MIHGFLVAVLYSRKQRLMLLLAFALSFIFYNGSFGGFFMGCHAYAKGPDSLQGLTSLRTVHKYFESAREIITARYGDEHAAAVEAASWPLEGSIEYYQMLRHHDRARLAAAAPSAQRRHLLSSATSNATYTFAGGNETESPFGTFFYAFIDIGTPSVEYFVALDTASDLLWVPCECQQCAPLSAPSADTRTSKLNEYSPSKSSTSKPVNCSNALCVDKTKCAASRSHQCPYTESTIYANTSTSGLLFEDNLYFIPEQGGGRESSPVVFGCGQTQTGSFLDGAIAPDGVLGLGKGDISVPSTLGRAGLVDSVSVCTGFDGTGRIAFGDKGPINQQTAPFVSTSSQENLVEITTLEVGSHSIPVGLNAIFDTLILMTYLPSAVYTPFVNTYRTLVTLPELNLTAQGFDLCYATINQSFEVPVVKFILPNGATFEPVGGGIVQFVNQSGSVVGFCVPIHNSTFPDIVIGLYNMLDYSFTYNQEDKLLGWIESNCYNDITTSAPAPAPIFAPVSTPSSLTPSPPSPLSSLSSSPPSFPPILSPSGHPPTSVGFIQFFLPSPILSMSLLGFLLYFSLF